MERRRYLRMHIPELRVHYNILPPERGRPMLAGFGKRDSHPAGRTGEEDAVFTALNRIEAKLDRVIGTMERGGGKPYLNHAEVLDISGGGLSLRSEQVQPMGTLLDLCIFPEYGDPRPVFAIGMVCRVDWQGDQTGRPMEVMGVEFVEIAEEDRDAVIRLVFQAERRQKRQAAKMD